MMALTDEQLLAANTAYTRVLFPECTPEQLADEWARMTPAFRLNTQEAMHAAIEAALGTQSKDGTNERQPEPREAISHKEHEPSLRMEAGDAGFVWRRTEHRRDWQTGVECALFRNEGPYLSSLLIRQADSIADHVWPGLRHYTFVNAEAVRGDGGGACFRYAGWKHCGRTAQGLLIMERLTPAIADTSEGKEIPGRTPQTQTGDTSHDQ